MTAAAGSLPLGTGTRGRRRADSLHRDTPSRYTFYTVDFEFDARKNRSNHRKHGIDFVEAQKLWSDPDLIVVPARTTDEPRFLVVGKIDGRHWSGIITYRGERVRLISVRRSRPEEVQLYES